MAVKVIIPTPLRAYAGRQESVEVQAATVGEALLELTTKFGDLKKHLFAEDGKLRSFVNVYVNDEDIRYLQKDLTNLKAGDTVSIVPSIAGGAKLGSISNRHFRN
jgi:adenylyltransferase/sulfurtransferase